MKLKKAILEKKRIGLGTDSSWVIKTEIKQSETGKGRMAKKSHPAVKRQGTKSKPARPGGGANKVAHRKKRKRLTPGTPRTGRIQGNQEKGKEGFREKKGRGHV